MRHERSRIGRLKIGIMGGGNLPGDSITELDGGFKGSHLHHRADAPCNPAIMAYYVTSFDNHFFSSSDLVDCNYVYKPPHLSSLIAFTGFPHPDTDLMFYQSRFQRDHAAGHASAIHLHPVDTALAAVRILHLYRVDRFTMPIAEAEAIPRRRNNRIYPHLIPSYL